MTFMVDGKQYVPWAGGIGSLPGFGPRGGPAPPALKPQLLVFTLDGKAELPKADTASGPTPAAPHQ